ncbi:hypothetical protein AZSP09_34660 [Azospira sp. I09]|jgi:hypothetical protein|nr:hypothetical protein AZSP09_34660 [Azospira sp. I09]
MHYFRNELWECKSESEFDVLEEDFATIAAFTNSDFCGPINSVREAKAEFEELQSAYEEQQYDEFKHSFSRPGHSARSRAAK